MSEEVSGALPSYGFCGRKASCTTTTTTEMNVFAKSRNSCGSLDQLSYMRYGRVSESSSIQLKKKNCAGFKENAPCSGSILE